MLLRAPPDVLRSPVYRTGALVLFGAVVIILAALAFQYIGGYSPCPLCVQQRYAYYAAIPALFLALVLVAADRPGLSALLFLAVALAFLGNAGLGVYHAGVEWKFWAGPDTCSARSTWTRRTRQALQNNWTQYLISTIRTQRLLSLVPDQRSSRTKLNRQ